MGKEFDVSSRVTFYLVSMHLFTGKIIIIPSTVEEVLRIYCMIRLQWQKRGLIIIIIINILVKVKNSSPKSLSANCRPTVGRLSANCRPTVGRLSANCRLTVGTKIFTKDCWPTVGKQSADSFLGELFFTFSNIIFGLDIFHLQRMIMAMETI